MIGWLLAALLWFLGWLALGAVAEDQIKSRKLSTGEHILLVIWPALIIFAIAWSFLPERRRG